MSTTSLQSVSAGPGTYVGAGVPWVAGKIAAMAKAVINDADAANSQNSIVLEIWASFNGGQTYVRQGTVSWTGGGGLPGGPTVPAVGTGYAGAGVVPTHVRADVQVLSGSFSVGANVDFS